MNLQKKRMLLCVTGGIAAYKAAELLRLLQKSDAEVQVAMSRAATQFVTPLTFQALSGKPVMCEQWPQPGQMLPDDGMAHIRLSRQSDLLLAAPASADFLARIAHGMADDLVSTAALARDCPLLVAPAMNRQMWENPATQRNIAQLMEDGVGVLGPALGEQACGEVGEGRMLEPDEIVEAVSAHFAPKHLKGKRVLISAGPTFEAIDPVRGITNLSSGRMGYALARAARHSDAAVTLISGPTAQTPPADVELVPVQSAAEMYEAVMLRARESDIFIGVAAVADYRVSNAAPEKLKKQSGVPRIELTENPDILASVAALPQPPFCVGFAAESEKLAEHAEAKRRRKGIPLVVGNLVQEALGQDESTLTLFDDAGAHPLPRADKHRQAALLIEYIAKAAQATTTN